MITKESMKNLIIHIYLFFQIEEEILPIDLVIWNQIQEVRICMLRTVGKIYTSIFSFLRKRNVYIAIIELPELGPVLNERFGNFTFYRGIHNFLRSAIFEFYAVVSISQNIY